ncbi:MAG: alpha-L-rhamnosidase, partial [Verrucomicrobiales bacterium]|nr:alpha-L-rhamnosidase [Verrucomicrobiales bacterium]
EFSVAKKISRARVYVSGLGYYELHLNGKRVGDQVLDPGWTSYSKRTLYSTYDVTDLLQKGENALGVMLGNGWYNPLPLRMWGKINPRDHLTIGEPRLILQLAIDFEDGTSQTVVTDETWRVNDGPVLRNSVYLGEVYDARKEQTGWDGPGFNDAKWQQAILAEKQLGELRAQDAPPIRVTRTLKAAKLTEPKPGVYIFDVGQNFAGWARLRVKGSAGTKVRLRYGELLYPDGTLNGMTSVTGQIKSGGKDYVYDGVGMPKTAFQLDECILRGDGKEEVFTPHFTFHGFRYVEVTGFPGKPELNALEGLLLNSDVAPAGEFSCSNEMFNRIQQMALWAELSNLFSVQSDCPHREKFGYGGDLVADSEMAMFNFDMARFYAKAINDFTDAVRPNGGFTETAPFVGISDFGLGEQSGPIGWGTAQPLLQWQLYQYYGDKRILEEQYENTKRWIMLLNSKAKDFILENGISDHESLVPKRPALTGTAFYFFNVKLFEKIARLLAKEKDANEAAALGEKIKVAFNQTFLNTSTGQYDIGTQCCQAFPLYMDLVPTAQKQTALDFLVNDITANQKGHLSTGIFGTKYMLHALADAGRGDVAYNIVNQKTFPGWGHMLENGATTLWEHWEFSDNTYSHNHPMFGSVSEWFYKVLAGINPASDAAGFDKIEIRPRPVGDLKWVKANYNSVRGKIVSNWENDEKHFTLHVTVPPNVTATVHLPTKNSNVTESGKPAKESAGVKFLRSEGDTSVFAVGSGDYTFVCGH